MEVARKSYIIQESGSVTIPAELREKYGLKAGDAVTFIETEAGLTISPREVLVNRLLDDLSEELNAQGVTLDDLMQTGREQRAVLLKRLYGIDEDA